MEFTTTAVNMLVMMAYAIPGYIFIKRKAFGAEAIPAFAKILLFVCQPCLTIYSFNSVTYTPELWKQMAIFFLVSLIFQLIAMLILFLIFRRKYEDASYRVCTVASVLGNVGFIGVPLLQALLPDYPGAIAFSAVFIVSMNIISWTFGLAILTGEKKYISIKKMLLNPAMVGVMIALPLFFTGIKLPSVIDNAVTILGKMTTPMSMLILGMRLSLVDIKKLFKNSRVYITALVKLLIFPLMAIGISYILPFESYINASFAILCCCPTASVVLSMSELYTSDKEPAANMILTSNIFCVITIPLLLLLVKV